MTDNLSLPQVAAAQNQKEVTINAATQQLSTALADYFAIATGNADYVLSSANFQNFMGFSVSGNTGTHKVTIPAIKRAIFQVRNTDSVSLNVVVGTTTISMPATSIAYFTTDGTANGLATANPPSGSTTLSGLTDVNLSSNANAQVLTFDSGTSKWENKNLPYDIGIAYSGKPGASQNINIVMVRSTLLPASLTNSQFKIGTNPTATMTFTLFKNGSSIGTVAFSTGGSPTVTFASPVTFAAGDVFGIQAPAVQDTTGADVSMTFLSTLQ